MSMENSHGGADDPSAKSAVDTADRPAAGETEAKSTEQPVWEAGSPEGNSDWLDERAEEKTAVEKVADLFGAFLADESSGATADADGKGLDSLKAAIWDVYQSAGEVMTRFADAMTPEFLVLDLLPKVLAIEEVKEWFGTAGPIGEAFVAMFSARNSFDAEESSTNDQVDDRLSFLAQNKDLIVPLIRLCLGLGTGESTEPDTPEQRWPPDDIQ